MLTEMFLNSIISLVAELLEEFSVLDLLGDLTTNISSFTTTFIDILKGIIIFIPPGVLYLIPIVFSLFYISFTIRMLYFLLTFIKRLWGIIGK